MSIEMDNQDLSGFAGDAFEGLGANNRRRAAP